MTKEHISVTRRKHSIENLDARIKALTDIYNSGVIPNDFNIHETDDRIAKWEDSKLGITKITVRIARDSHPERWSQIQALKLELKKISKKKLQIKATKKSKNKDSVIEMNKQHKKELSKLTNELIMLRAAYLDLSSAITEDKHKNKVLHATIKRHHTNLGLKKVIDNKK
jgi:hypothetical protein